MQHQPPTEPPDRAPDPDVRRKTITQPVRGSGLPRFPTPGRQKLTPSEGCVTASRSRKINAKP